MDQQRIGVLLRDLRKEKGVTQEELAERLGVSSRSVSRWENGATMPDFDILLELAEYYDVGIGEILAGKREEMSAERGPKETLIQVADYTNEENIRFQRRLHVLLLVAVAESFIYIVLNLTGLAQMGYFYEAVAGFCSGSVFGVLLVGALLTSRHGAKLRAFKRRRLRREE